MASLRILAAFLLIAACSGTGFWTAGRLRARTEQTENLLRLLTRLETLLLQRLPTPVLNDMLKRERLLPASGWDGLIAALPAPEQAVCARVAGGLGRGSAEAQAKSVRLAAGELGQLLQQARQAEREKSRLYPTLGLLAGLFAAVAAL